MKILHNHVGYRPEARKVLILQTDGTESIHTDVRASLLAEETGKVVMDLSYLTAGPVDRWQGRYFYRFDFSEWKEEGVYRFCIRVGGAEVYGFPFRIGQDVNDAQMVSDIVHYFKGQRSSGRWDEVDRSLPFHGGRDGRVDAHGGWFDASGDYSKYLSHLSYANYLNPQQIPLTVWSLARSGEHLAHNDLYASTLLVERLFEEAHWGADFLMRMQDDAGYFYTTVFDTWSKQDEKRKITAFRTQQGILLDTYQAGFRSGGGMAIAALARIARVKRTHIPSDGYTSEQFLAAADKGYRHLAEHNTKYLDNGIENIIDCYCALVSAVELYRSTKNRWYLMEARTWAQRLASHFDYTMNAWVVEIGSERPFYHASDTGLILLSLFEYLSIEEDLQSRKDTACVIFDSLMSELEMSLVEGNPFRYSRQLVQGVNDSEPRVSFFVPHDNESGYWWQGENARLASMTAMLRVAVDYIDELYELCDRATLVEEREMMSTGLNDLADAQLDWILGCNPFDVCMLQGYGRHNPRYEKFYPNAPGGICNGITGGFEDEKDIDFLPAGMEGRGDQRWRWSEQWLPHASWFLLAITHEL